MACGSRHVRLADLSGGRALPGPCAKAAPMSFAARRAYACPICSEGFLKWSICQSHVNTVAARLSSKASFRLRRPAAPLWATISASRSVL